MKFERFNPFAKKSEKLSEPHTDDEAAELRDRIHNDPEEFGLPPKPQEDTEIA